MERYRTSPTKRAVGKYLGVAEKHGLTLTELALAWCRTQWFVTSSIIGATSMEQLREDIAAFALGDLPDEVLDDVDEVYREVREPTLKPPQTRVEARRAAEEAAAGKEPRAKAYSRN